MASAPLQADAGVRDLPRRGPPDLLLPLRRGLPQLPLRVRPLDRYIALPCPLGASALAAISFRPDACQEAQRAPTFIALTADPDSVSNLLRQR